MRNDQEEHADCSSKPAYVIERARRARQRALAKTTDTHGPRDIRRERLIAQWQQEVENGLKGIRGDAA